MLHLHIKFYQKFRNSIELSDSSHKKNLNSNPLSKWALAQLHLLPLYVLGWGLNCGFKNQDRLVVCYLPQKKKKNWSPYYIYLIDFLDWLPSNSGLIMFMPCVSFCCYISSFLFSYRLRNFLRKQHEKLPMKADIFSLMIILTRALTPDMKSLPNELMRSYIHEKDS